MPKLPGINHLNAIRAFEKIGFVITRQGKHVIMRRGDRRIVIPRGSPINAFTMGGIIRDAGLTIEEFKNLL
jgi:predicted RNA binding protein YcfA (HicA-like mRNA interferase family)